MFSNWGKKKEDRALFLDFDTNGVIRTISNTTGNNPEIKHEDGFTTIKIKSVERIEE